MLRNIAVLNHTLDPKWLEDLSLVEVQENHQDWWDALPDGVRLKMAMGLAWEAWYLENLEGVVFHPGEMHIDGIYMTHDGESLDTIVSDIGARGYAISCHEVKLTYKSTKTVGEDLSTQWLWIAQGKGYCKGLNCLTLYVHVLFACGDYSFPITPVLKVWKVMFTQLEVDDHWDTVVSFVEHRQQQEREDLMKDTY